MTMGECWFCHNGWHPRVRAISNRYRDLLDMVEGRGEFSEDGETCMKYKQAHVAWADENFDTWSILSCIEYGVKEKSSLLKTDGLGRHFTELQWKLVQRSLRELLRVPLDQRIPPEQVAYEASGSNSPADFKPAWA